jgi:hypothetical protein
MYKYFNKILIILIAYNALVLSILSIAPLSIKDFFWKITPYSYKQVLGFPLNLKTLDLRYKNNQDQILSFLEKNENRNNLDIDFWNYKLNILNINQQYSDEIQEAFYKTFILSKNNENKNAELKNYFLINYSNFDKNYQDKIIEKF